jgi:hypothetical protein
MEEEKQLKFKNHTLTNLLQDTLVKFFVCGEESDLAPVDAAAHQHIK